MIAYYWQKEVTHRSWIQKSLPADLLHVAKTHTSTCIQHPLCLWKGFGTELLLAAKVQFIPGLHVCEPSL